MQPIVRNGLTVLAAASGYAACAVVGIVLRSAPDGFAIVWPATAWLVGLLLILPRRQWWCAAAVIPVHFTLAWLLQPEVRLAIVAIEIAGSLALAFATVLALRRAIGPALRFENFREMLTYVLVAGLAVPAVVNLAMLAIDLAAGWIGDPWIAWRQWMVAGFMPTITIPPLVVLAANGDLLGRPAASAWLKLELALIAVLLFTAGALAFKGVIDLEYAALFIAPLPLLIWAAARTGVGGTCISLLALAAGMLVPALRHEGPFAPGSPVDATLSLQVFLTSRAAIMLLLAALLDERRRTADLLRRFETGIQVAAASTDTGLWQWDVATRRLSLTGNCRAMFGLPDSESNTPFDFLGPVDPEDQALVRDALAGALDEGRQIPVLEFRLRRGDDLRWFVLQTRTECDENGRTISISGVFRDISERIESRLAVERLEERLATLQDDERRRIAQELHDSTAQHLVAAKFQLLTLRNQVADELHELVDEAYRSLREATAEIRTFTYLLHGSQLDEDGLSTILQRYLPGFERRTGVRTTLRLCPRADELPGVVQHALLRITQESLGNVQRHAGAKRAAVDLRCFAQSLHLVVRDDGKGIGPTEGAQLAERLRLGLGLPVVTVRARASARRSDRTGRGRGTTIHVRIPLETMASPGARGIANIAREALGAGRG